MTITVYVKLFATLRRRFPGLELGAEIPLQLPDGTTIADLNKQLQLPADLVKIVFVNHTVRNNDFILADGDRVSIFPPVGGG